MNKELKSCEFLPRIFAVVLTGFCFLFASENLALADEKNLVTGKVQNTRDFFNNSSEKIWSIMVFGGKLSSGNLDDVFTFSSNSKFTDTSFVGAAVSREMWRNDWIALELEGGIGQQFGGLAGNDTTQFWGAGYVRYYKFPWNHIVRTSIAGSVGVNYSTKKTVFENNETSNGDTSNLQHYFSPEITFGLPDYPDADLVFRIHHRSSVWGLFGCEGCGSNVPTVGMRLRF